MAANLPVTSREYKLMLNPDRFRDRDKDREEFLELVKFIIDKEGGEYVEQKDIDDEDPVETRQTFYLDTPEKGFNEHRFLLRVRKKGKFALNLKYRGPDRYVAAAQNVEITPPTGSEPEPAKFEEDVLPPFVGQFARSVSIKKLSALPDFSTVAGVAAVFPGLGALGIPADTPVVTANSFVAHEVAVHIGGFRFPKGDEAATKVKMALSFWYLQAAKTGWPMVGEFSFDYDAPDGTEEFPPATVEGAGRVFRAIQLQAGWLDLNGTTKSAFALSGI